VFLRVSFFAEDLAFIAQGSADASKDIGFTEVFCAPDFIRATAGYSFVDSQGGFVRVSKHQFSSICPVEPE
jgi:hypothetical protein